MSTFHFYRRQFCDDSSSRTAGQFSASLTGLPITFASSKGLSTSGDSSLKLQKDESGNSEVDFKFTRTVSFNLIVDVDTSKVSLNLGFKIFKKDIGKPIIFLVLLGPIPLVFTIKETLEIVAQVAIKNTDLKGQFTLDVSATYDDELRFTNDTLKTVHYYCTTVFPAESHVMRGASLVADLNIIPFCMGAVQELNDF